MISLNTVNVYLTKALLIIFAAFLASCGSAQVAETARAAGEMRAAVRDAHASVTKLREEVAANDVQLDSLADVVESYDAAQGRAERLEQVAKDATNNLQLT